MSAVAPAAQPAAGAAAPAPAPVKPHGTKRRDKDDSNNAELGVPHIGNYVFVKTLGEGNFAKVKLARHKLTGQEVAIKIIDKTTLDDKKLSKLYREVRIMKMLHHPNIVKLYEVIETKHTLFLVMEAASGGELYDYLVVHGRMKEKEARAKFRQILSAVHYCHRKKVIHRDLKAENLLLDSFLNVKIADFGFSNTFDPDGKLDTFCGSPPYAAPELFQGRRYVGPEVDVWSLGVILYVLVTGCLPFDGKNLQEMRESVCRGKYRIPFYLSDACEKLLRKMLVRDPTKRASLDFLADDAWINEGYADSPIIKDVSSAPVEEDEEIIAAMIRKFPPMERDTLLQSLRQNLYDDISAIYYLMYYEKQAKGADFKLSPDSATAPVLALADGDANLPPLPAQEQKDRDISIGADQQSARQAKGRKPTSPNPSFASIQEGGAQPVVQQASTAPAAIRVPTAAMARIDEDAVLSEEPEHDPVLAATEQQPPAAEVKAVPRPAVIAIPVDSRSARRRRFTVGGEAEVAKLAEDEERNYGPPTGPEAAELLRRLQNLQREQQAQMQQTDADDRRNGALRGARDVPTHPVSMVKMPQRTAPGASENGPLPSITTGRRLEAQSAAQPISPTEGDKAKKRHSTIGGFLKSHLRRQSDSPAVPGAQSGYNESTYYTAAMIAETSNLPNEVPMASGSTAPVAISTTSVDPNDDKPRSLRFTFNSSTTSSKHPDDIVHEVVGACEKTGMMCKAIGKYLLECSCPAAEAGMEGEGGAVGSDVVRFEVEVCKLPRLKNLHGLRFKRVQGSSGQYKTFTEKLMAAISL
ncbi:MAP/microtubule affinity-regulating kinase 1 [Hyaloraphidium curvatum]|nr:MAP/microtubule affinity-regulating kinase 1 [Hyaloraphidium curvatum]